MKLIGFGELSYYLFFPLVTPILSSLFVIVSRSFVSLNQQTKVNDTEDNLYKHPLVTAFLFFISQSLAGILELISRKLQKEKRDSNHLKPRVIYQDSQMIDLIKAESTTTSFSVYYIIFGLVIVETIAMSIACLMFTQKQDVLISQLIAMQMIFSGLFSYPILNYKIYRHQFFAIGMFLFGVGTIAIPTIVHTNCLYILGIFAGVILWSFQSVTAKYLMETKFISQFMYLFLHGTMGAGFLGLVLIVTPYIPCSLSTCDNGVLENTWNTLSYIFSQKYLLNFFFLLIVTCAYNTFQLTTIKLFTPTHNDATESMGSMLSWLYMAYIDPIADARFVLPMQVFGYLLMIVASLMYNEIIIVYVFSLGEYTKKEIKRRSKEDDKEIQFSLMEEQIATE